MKKEKEFLEVIEMYEMFRKVEELWLNAKLCAGIGDTTPVFLND